MTKLCDANNAGSRYGKDCTLILTEGDSAKALAVAGLSVVGRDNFGVFPLRGKLLNVREANHDQIMKNEEIQNIKKIMGLQHNKEYTSRDSLRYGRIMIMADQVRATGWILEEYCNIWFRITMVRTSRDSSSTSLITSTHRFSSSTISSLSSLLPSSECAMERNPSISSPFLSSSNG